jgi:signal transduction histidine kinase
MTRDSERLSDRDRSPRISATAIATLANDLRNLLSVMANSVDALRTTVAPGAQIERIVADLDDAIDGAFEIGREMVALVQPRRAESSISDVNDVVTQTARVIERLVGDAVRVWLKVSASSALVRAGHIEIEWLLLNLAANAAEAMPDGGLLTIETALVTVPAHTTNGGRSELQTFVRITVSDTGAGMTPDVRIRAAEPFFSTKPGGFGLGLTSAAIAVRRLGGVFRVENTGPEGTSVEVYLPAHERRAPSQ